MLSLFSSRSHADVFTRVVQERKKAGPKKPYYDEKDFAYDNPTKVVDGYVQAKIMQEQEIIKFRKDMKQRPSEHQIEIVTLHPSFILGPPLNHLASSSVEGFRKICSGQVPMVPQLHAGTIDVRDCAQAHINALLAEPGLLQDERIIVSDKSLWMMDHVNFIREHFKDKGLTKIPTLVAGSKLLYLASFFDGTLKFLLPRVGVEAHFDNSKSKELLGMKYERDVSTIAVDMVQAMIDHGILEVPK